MNVRTGGGASASEGETAIGVVVIDPLPVVRAGIGRLVGDRPGMVVLAEAGDADAAIVAIEPLRRTRVVVVVDLALRGGHDALWLTREIRRRYPSYAILACGDRPQVVDVSRALFMGADGFVDKELEADAFLQAVEDAADGGMVLTGVAADMVGAIADDIDHRRGVEASLTDREREVLAVAAEGLTAREIAERLGVRERTVTTHLGRIYGKLGVGSRLAAIRAVSSPSRVVAVPD
jgi:DNA-binding NarL/FixJ family response regulator